MNYYVAIKYHYEGLKSYKYLGSDQSLNPASNKIFLLHNTNLSFPILFIKAQLLRNNTYKRWYKIWDCKFSANYIYYILLREKEENAKPFTY